MQIHRLSLVLFCGAALAVSACARQPQPVTITPIYDKFGEASCPADTIVDTDSETGAEFCAPIDS